MRIKVVHLVRVYCEPLANPPPPIPKGKETANWSVSEMKETIFQIIVNKGVRLIL